MFRLPIKGKWRLEEVEARDESLSLLCRKHADEQDPETVPVGVHRVGVQDQHGRHGRGMVQQEPIYLPMQT